MRENSNMKQGSSLIMHFVRFACEWLVSSGNLWWGAGARALQRTPLSRRRDGNVNLLINVDRWTNPTTEREQTSMGQQGWSKCAPEKSKPTKHLTGLVSTWRGASKDLRVALLFSLGGTSQSERVGFRVSDEKTRERERAIIVGQQWKLFTVYMAAYSQVINVLKAF